MQPTTQVKAFDAVTGKFLTTSTSPILEIQKEKRKMRSVYIASLSLTNKANIPSHTHPLGKGSSHGPHSHTNFFYLLTPAEGQKGIDGPISLKFVNKEAPPCS